MMDFSVTQTEGFWRGAGINAEFPSAENENCNVDLSGQKQRQLQLWRKYGQSVKKTETLRACEKHNRYEIIERERNLTYEDQRYSCKNERHFPFEVFPPKTEDKYESVEQVASEIAKLNPAFMSVTYGAGGGTSQYTVDIAASALKARVTPLAHLTCVSSTREKVHSVLDQLKAQGIENVLALRGIFRRMEK